MDPHTQTINNFLIIHLIWLHTRLRCRIPRFVALLTNPTSLLSNKATHRCHDSSTDIYCEISSSDNSDITFRTTDTSSLYLRVISDNTLDFTSFSPISCRTFSVPRFSEASDLNCDKSGPNISKIGVEICRNKKYHGNKKFGQLSCKLGR